MLLGIHNDQSLWWSRKSAISSAITIQLPKEGSYLGSELEMQYALPGHSSWSFMTSNLQMSFPYMEPAHQAKLEVVQQTLAHLLLWGPYNPSVPLSSKGL